MPRADAGTAYDLEECRRSFIATNRGSMDGGLTFGASAIIFTNCAARDLA
jgi:hypothetical protein